MSKHTQGTWRVRPDAGAWSATYDARGSSAYEAVLADDEVVALVVARNNDPWSEPPDTTHNARLIAAAPDLLEALELARDHIDMTALEVSHRKDAERIRAAIAKARGELFNTTAEQPAERTTR
jgi:hypothetical protein